MVTIHAKSHEDQYILDNSTIRRFIDAVNEIRYSGLDAHATVAKIRPHFADLMADQTWLPEMYQEPAEGSGMGGGTGMWLLYRAGDEGLAFSSLVLRPGCHPRLTITLPGAWLVCTAASRTRWSIAAVTMLRMTAKQSWR